MLWTLIHVSALHVSKQHIITRHPTIQTALSKD